MAYFIYVIALDLEFPPLALLSFLLANICIYENSERYPLEE